MIAASCSEDVPTLALLAAEVKRIWQKTSLLAFRTISRRALRFVFGVLFPSGAALTLSGRRAILRTGFSPGRRRAMKTPQELLHQALEVGECLLPDAPPGGRSAHPTVFVHGCWLGRAGCALPRRALLGARGGRRARLSQPLRIRLPRGLGRHHLERVGPRV